MTAHEVIQTAIRSGHGIGKSALVAWLIIWAMATKPFTRGVVTANTEAQLKGKTWPELGKWHAMSLCREMFKFTATSYFSSDPDEVQQKNWRIDLVPWSENNTEAFAGLHNAGRRLILVFDEASAIPNGIWEVAEGALTDKDTEILWCAFGNPTRNQGRFHDCFNKLSHRWWTRGIDSRTVPGINLKQVQKWLDDWGEDSDFFRVRVRGMAPRAAFNQFIGQDLVQGARTRAMHYVTPKVACVGVDVARFGDDSSVIFTRIGRDGRSVPSKRFNGLDNMQLVGEIASHVNYLQQQLGLRVVLFVDGGNGGGVVDRLRELGYEVIEVLFGAAADNPKRYANKRAEMYGRARDWLKVGYLEEANNQLEEELCAVLYQFQRDAIQLERKEILKDREGVSPDEADAFVCTFAYPVPPAHNDELPGGAPPRAGNQAAKARRNYNPRGPRSCATPPLHWLYPPWWPGARRPSGPAARSDFWAAAPARCPRPQRLPQRNSRASPRRRRQTPGSRAELVA